MGGGREQLVYLGQTEGVHPVNVPLNRHFGPTSDVITTHPFWLPYDIAEHEHGGAPADPVERPEEAMNGTGSDPMSVGRGNAVRMPHTH
jgi:hypothetical protein